MKSNISIVYVNTNPNVDEKIAIGAIYLSGTDSKFLVIKRKVDLAKVFLRKEQKEFLDTYLKQIQNKMTAINSYTFTSINKEYMDYLNRYNSQGFITIGRSKPINLKLTQLSLERVLTKILDEEGISNQSFVRKRKSNQLIIGPDRLKGLLKSIEFIEGYYSGNSVQLYKEFEFNRKGYYLANGFYELEFFRDLLAQKIDVKQHNIAIGLVAKTTIKNQVNNEYLVNIFSKKNYEIFTNEDDISIHREHLYQDGYKRIETII